MFIRLLNHFNNFRDIRFIIRRQSLLLLIQNIFPSVDQLSIVYYSDYQECLLYFLDSYPPPSFMPHQEDQTYYEKSDNV
ncbi:hypothetical protein CASFOL_030800 [Castilleja foliolosa]|uniref:Uncharacterized protein n=1 Tax=Castilleja foliolosa TaxID=1961234 RepID=A0ABD3C8A7_9LAMI